MSQYIAFNMFQFPVQELKAIRHKSSPHLQTPSSNKGNSVSSFSSPDSGNAAYSIQDIELACEIDQNWCVLNT
jgi:hypothetical protein